MNEELPPTKELLSDLGKKAKEEGRYRDAIDLCKQILRDYPSDAMTYANMAGVYSQMSSWKMALELFEKARNLAPTTPRHHDDFVYFLHHAPVSEEALSRAHREYGELMLPRELPLPPRASRNAKIRLGYLSADLHEHATAFLLEAILEHHDKSQFEIFLYSTDSLHDRFTERLTKHAGTIRVLREKSPDSIREQIIADQIDILIDLGGHTGSNNLEVFALRAAPLQVSWFSYMDTSGLRAIDYRITDSWRTPPHRARFYTEELIYLTNSYTFKPPLDLLPPLTPLPALAGAPFTFGSFNTSHKINELTLDLWSALLARHTSARLLIMIPKSAEYRDWILGEFEKRSIKKERIVPHEYTTLEGLYALMGKVDTALDTYPYTGGATTYHSLLAGLPTITLKGRTEYERNSGAIMHEVGLDDWIANSPDEYLALALKKSANLPALAQLRPTLRSRVGAHSREIVREVEGAFVRALTQIRATKHLSRAQQTIAR